MYNEIIENLKLQLTASELDKILSQKIHLGIFNNLYLPYILNGKKTIESRFSKNKILPYNNITEDLIVFIKESGKSIIGYFTIKKVLFYNLNHTKISDIKKEYNKYLCVDKLFWDKKKNSNYATLIFIDQVFKLKPFNITKKGMQTWLTLN